MEVAVAGKFSRLDHVAVDRPELLTGGKPGQDFWFLVLLVLTSQPTCLTASDFDQSYDSVFQDPSGYMKGMVLYSPEP